MRIFYLLITMLLSNSAFAEQVLQFGVLNQRSVLLTAQLWNPILAYVTEKTGVPLALAMGRTVDDSTAKTVRGDFDFVYTNHLFTPERDKLGYRVIARFDNAGISGLVVTAANSAYKTLSDLNNQTIAFPSVSSFAAYTLTKNALDQAAVHIQPQFVGNQEAALSNVQYGKAVAAGVNNVVLATYSQREKEQFRILYQSPVYFDIPVMANPRVPAATVNKVQAALANMAQDARGKQILLEASQYLKMDKPLRFIRANNQDYENYRVFYRHQQMSEH